MKIKYSKVKGSKPAKVIASAAKTFAAIGANSACCFIYHQPEKPDLRKLRKY